MLNLFANSDNLELFLLYLKIALLISFFSNMLNFYFDKLKIISIRMRFFL